MKQKGRFFLSFLLALVMVLGLMPGMSMTAYADATPTYKIVVTSPAFNRTYSEDITLPVTFGGSWLLSYMGYGNYTATSITKVSGDDIVNIDGTNVSVNGAGTVGLNVYVSGGWGTVGFIVTKNITATATGFSGAYDGQDHSISADVTVPSSGYTIMYGTSNGTYNLTESPKYKDAGNYTVYYQVTADGYNTKTGSATVNIGKANAPAVDTPTPAAVTYDPAKTLKDVTLPDGWVWADETTVPTVSNNGYEAALTVDDANYDYTGVEGYDAQTHKVTRTVALTVNKPAASVAYPVEAVTTEYIGQAQKLANGGVYSRGTMQYALGTDADTVPTSGWTEDVPTAKDAGIYYVWYKVVGDANHSDSDPAALTSTIRPRTVTVNNLTVYGKYYDGTTTATLNTRNASFSNKVGNDQLTVSGNAAFTDANVGSNKTVNITGLTLGGDSAKNYALSSTTATITGTINKIYVKVTAQNQTVLLNGSIDTSVNKAMLAAGANDPVSSHVLSAITLTDSGTGNATTNGTITPSNAVIKDGTGNDVTANYGFSYKTGVLTVEKAASSIETAPTAKNLTYNGAAQALVDAGSATGGTMQYSLDGSNYSSDIPKGINAGTYTVYYKVIGDANHNDTAAAHIAVTISSANTTPTNPSADTLTYTGAAQPLVTGGSVTGGELQYALGTDATNAPGDGWSTDIPTAAEPGTYYVWYRVVGDANHNDVAPVCVVVTIEAPAEIVAPAPEEIASISDYTLLATMKASGKKALKLSWTKVADAEGYDVFFGPCGGEYALKTTVTGWSCKIGKLKKGMGYKAYVRAWKTVNGAKTYIGQSSPSVHAIAGGKSNRYTNPKKITVKKKKLSLKAGTSKKIKASVKKLSSSRHYLNHTAKIRYYSSNRGVATVDANGRVSAVGSGSCTVYALAENGLRVGVKITVK